MSTSVSSTDVDSSDRIPQPSSMLDLVRSPRVQAYVELTKLRISIMVLLTFAVAALLAAHEFQQPVSPLLMLGALAGMLLIAGSGNAMNMYLERYSDFLMPRTASRPLPAHKLSATEVATFAAVTFSMGIVILFATVNWQTAACGIANWLLYVFIYTPLKRYHWSNTEVGAVAGAMPVLMGTLATTEQVGLLGWSLFGVLILWQFPHFMAIAWKYRDQYRAGGLKMLTVTEPTGLAAGRKSVFTAVLLIGCSLIPLLRCPTWWQTFLLAGVALLLGGYYLKASIVFYRDRNLLTARSLMLVSLLYLPLYMLTLMLTCLI